MKLSSAIKKIEKAGLKLESKDNYLFWVKNGNYTFEFFAVKDWQDETKMIVQNFCIVLSAAKANDKNPFNSNCYNIFYDNFTKALRSLLNK